MFFNELSSHHHTLSYSLDRESEARGQKVKLLFLLERENSNGNQRDPVRYAIVDSLDCTLISEQALISLQGGIFLES